VVASRIALLLISYYNPEVVINTFPTNVYPTQVRCPRATSEDYHKDAAE
jgi:hypothetical protein